MAEETSTGGESHSKDIDLKLATGIGVVINIGHQCSHVTTSNSATGTHTRNFQLMDGGSNNFMGNDAHDDSTTMSGTIYGSSWTSQTRNASDNKAKSLPLATRPPPPGHIANDPTGPREKPSSFALRPSYQVPAGRQYFGSTFSPPSLQGPESSKPRSRSMSALARSEARSINGFDTPSEIQRPSTATCPGHATLSSSHHLPYIDKPPHQDVAIQHIHCEPEASLQTDWIDNQLLGRVIELSAEDTHLHRRAMVVMAVSAGVRFLQCLHICRHPEMLRGSSEFYETHVAVVEKHGAGNDVLIPRDVAIVIDQPETYALRGQCYINYQHVWTVRRDVGFRNIGVVDDFQRLKHSFREAQKVLYQDQ